LDNRPALGIASVLRSLRCNGRFRSRTARIVGARMRAHCAGWLFTPGDQVGDNQLPTGYRHYAERVGEFLSTQTVIGCTPRYIVPKIRRAEREHLEYVSGRSDDLLRKFYALLLRTRWRHSLPPQPLYWFRNLIEAMGNNLTIRLVSKDDYPVAAMLILSHRATVTYKYGCSDERLNYLGGTPFLFWKTIQEAKNQGMLELDLGRSDLRQKGLIDFKDRLGATKTVLTYGRYPGRSRTDSAFPLWQRRIAKGVFSCVPEPVFVASGRFLYRHLG
jgi:Acetyltransferase (GNAT) domain